MIITTGKFNNVYTTFTPLIFNKQDFNPILKGKYMYAISLLIRLPNILDSSCKYCYTSSTGAYLCQYTYGAG